MTSSAVILYTTPDPALPDDPENNASRRWAVVLDSFSNPSPGRTLSQIYSGLGRFAEKLANRAAHSIGLGPHAVAQRIRRRFGRGEQRLELLHKLNSRDLDLEQCCRKLMRYALPTESVDTQIQTFQEISELVTLFPGLRRFLLISVSLQHTASMEAISALWGDHECLANEKWTFWKGLATTCLADTRISAIVEQTTIEQLANCETESLSVIERLVLEIAIERENHSEASEMFSAICIRYLGGILDLPGFWSNMGTAHFSVAKKLCSEMACVLEDIGADILELGPVDESQTDHSGIDFLATIMLNGFLGWIGKLHPENWAIQLWYENLPRAAELLPVSSALAMNSFEDIFPTTYILAEVDIMMKRGIDSLHDYVDSNVGDFNSTSISPQHKFRPRARLGWQ
ncbi:High osmolarity signaling protein SHO1 [Mycena sanguinolenta]|uniref:High osmolarity signaling protein SHO1 n=1 Tax=Mycena sanguinolenta TaxID=230812 RepID=A0A8H6ZHA4_9AGAR|nr:High osmolarity signaling protein SHO1 [Mycena sanguinolenta]